MRSLRLLGTAGAMMLVSLRLGFGVASVASASAAPGQPSVDRLKPYEHWITGDVFTEGGALLFRTDKAVSGDNRQNVVLLGCTRQAGVMLGPLYIRAAEKHMRLRLFGALLPYSGSIKDSAGTLPNVEFITWKMHLPSDPDELPDDHRILLDEHTPKPTYSVTIEPESPSPTQK